MHGPPAVSHATGRSRWHGFLLATLWSASLGLIGYFSYLQVSVWSPALLLAAWLFSGGMAMWVWRTSPVGLLQWDGEQWHWLFAGHSHVCEPRIVWDMQRFLLVRTLGADRRESWLWLEAGENLLRWSALRRALVGTNAEYTEPSPPDDLEGQR